MIKELLKDYDSERVFSDLWDEPYSRFLVILGWHSAKTTFQANAFLERLARYRPTHETVSVSLTKPNATIRHTKFKRIEQLSRSEFSEMLERASEEDEKTCSECGESYFWHKQCKHDPSS